MAKKKDTKSKQKTTAKKPENNKVAEVLESRVFSTAMRVGETYASNKSKVFRVLQHAFEKLKAESSRSRLKAEFQQQTSILMRLLKAYYRGVYKKIPARAIIKILGGLIYFVWVIDLIPDFIPILGLADDIAVIIWVYNGLKDELDDFEQWESVTAVSIDTEK